MYLNCKQHERVGGTFARGKASGDDATHTPEPYLWVTHSGDNFAYPEAGRQLYSAQDFVEGKTFRAYSKMLESDFEDHTTKIQGGRAVEYLSPLAVIREDDVEKGDCFIDVMYRNASAFTHPVRALQTPKESSDDKDNGAYSFSLRMHKVRV